MVKRFNVMFFALICFLILPLHGLAGVLVDQPLSIVNTEAYHNQDYEQWFSRPESDIWIADDFDVESGDAWHVSSIFVPGDFITNLRKASSLRNAEVLTWYVYANNGGEPAGDPIGGGHLWSISLSPDDPQVSITDGSGGRPSDVTLNLAQPPRFNAGKYWLVFYPKLEYNLYGEIGRQPSDITNGSDEALIMARSDVDGFPTDWTPVLDPSVPWEEQGFKKLPLPNFAFRMEGGLFPSAMDVNPRALNFGNVMVGTPAELPVTISATGSFTVTGITSSSGTFEVDAGSCVRVYTNGTTCDVNVTFNPTAGGAQSATLDIAVQGAGIAQVSLSGTGVQAEPSIAEGTVGTRITFTNAPGGFTDKKGKVFIYNGTKKSATKIAKGDWTNDAVTCTISKALQPGAYPVRIQFKRDKTKLTYEAGTFTFKKPEITVPLAVSEGLPGTEITIQGMFFGTKKGKVYVEDQASGKRVNCKVKTWSMTDPVNGNSTITFVVPKLPKGINPGAYPLKVSNKVGTSTENPNFTILSNDL